MQFTNAQLDEVADLVNFFCASDCRGNCGLAARRDFERGVVRALGVTAYDTHGVEQAWVHLEAVEDPAGLSWHWEDEEGRRGRGALDNRRIWAVVGAFKVRAEAKGYSVKCQALGSGEPPSHLHIDARAMAEWEVFSARILKTKNEQRVRRVRAWMLRRVSNNARRWLWYLDVGLDVGVIVLAVVWIIVVSQSWATATLTIGTLSALVLAVRSQWLAERQIVTDELEHRRRKRCGCSQCLGEMQLRPDLTRARATLTDDEAEAWKRVRHFLSRMSSSGSELVLDGRYWFGFGSNALRRLIGRSRRAWAF